MAQISRRRARRQQLRASAGVTPEDRFEPLPKSADSRAFAFSARLWLLQAAALHG